MHKGWAVSNITPFNDHVLIELEKSEWATASEDVNDPDNPNAALAGTGIVIAIPERKTMQWFSSYNWIAEHSVISNSFMDDLHKTMQTLKGKRVYFEKRADIGNVVEDGDKKYATIKLSKITGIANANAN